MDSEGVWTGVGEVGGKGTSEGKGKKGLRITHFGWSRWETDGNTQMKILYSGGWGRALALDLTYLVQVQALLLDLPSFSSLSSALKWKTSSWTHDLTHRERLMSSGFH